MKNPIIFIFTFFILINSAFAQEGVSTSEDALKEKVKEYLGRPNPEFAAALPLLLKLHDNSPKDVALNYTLGYCYTNLDDERALPYLEYCLRALGEMPDEFYYYLARSYHLEMKFDKAIEYYEKFRTQFKKPEKHEKEINEIWHEEKMCKNGIEMMKKPSDIEVFSLGDAVNSQYPEYGPIFNADNDLMIFTSCRPDTKGG